MGIQLFLTYRHSFMVAEEKYNELIVRHLDGGLSDKELDDLLQWLKKDEANFRYFLELKDIWCSAEMMEACGDTEENALARFNEKYPEKKVSLKRPERVIRISMQIAATLLLACLLSLTWNWLTKAKHTAPAPENEFAQVYIPKGQKGQITLSDGTHVWLNSNSTLRYPAGFGNDSRKVVLDGEAYLEVAKDPARPFFLETFNLTLKVLGTSFNIKSYSTDNTVETTLIEGSLEILSGKSRISRSKKIILKPNEKAVFMKPNNEISIAPLDLPEKKEPKLSRRIKTTPMTITQVESIISWKDNHLIFRDESFEEIAKKMESWYGVEIRIENENLKHYRFTGKFVYNEPIDQVMEVISRTTPLQYSLNKNILVIRSK